jgi:hypothetical protein
MKPKSIYLNFLIYILLSGIVLSACSLTAAPQTAPTPAASTVDTALIKTNVAETVYAGLTQTALALPTETSVSASATPLQSAVAPASATPINTMTSMPISGTAAATVQWVASATPEKTSTPVNKDFRCAILSQTIADSKVMFPGESFQAGWTVENRGTAYWNSAGLDIVYHSGTEMQKGARFIDLPQSVPPTGNFSFSISMEAPGSVGTYETTWMLSGDPGAFCPMTVKIKVE